MLRRCEREQVSKCQLVVKLKNATGARPQRAAVAARHRRRGDRIGRFLLRLLTAAFAIQIPQRSTCAILSFGSMGRCWAVKRREFITLLGGAAAWPLGADAQQDRVRHVGVLMPHVQNDTVARARIAALSQELQQLGWSPANLLIGVFFAGPFAASIRKHAADLAALAPDVIVANGSVTLGPLLEVTHTVPIVFVIVPDPVGGGFVDNLARPGGTPDLCNSNTA
jgi:hypothetical protein